MVVNPAHRVLDGEVRKKGGLLNRRIDEFGAINLHGEIKPATVEAYVQKKSDLQEVITRLKKEVDELKAQRKATQRHIAYKELPADARFDRLSTQSKHLVHTLKMIASRTAPAISHLLRQSISLSTYPRTPLPA